MTAAFIIVFLTSAGCKARKSSKLSSGTIEGGIRPIIVVHGWRSNGGEQIFARHLRDLEMPAERIHIVRYDDQKDWSGIADELEPQFAEIFARYPDDVQLDVIGHFVSIYTVTTRNMAGRIRQLTGIAGVAHGLDRTTKVQLIRLFVSPGASLTALFHDPDRNSNVHLDQFYGTFKDALNSFQKCSVYSTDDGIVYPPNTAAFNDGRNMDVPDMKHAEAFIERRWVENMVRFCYAKNWPPRL